MPDILGNIRSKKTGDTGITEQLLSSHYGAKGRHFMAIVEYRVDETHEKADGTRKVDLVLTQVEPAEDETLAAHLRNLTRTVYYNRSTGGQPTLMDAGSDEPTVAQVLAAGAALEPHPFVPVDASQDNPICDVCGVIEDANPGHHPEAVDAQSDANAAADDDASRHGDGPEPEDPHDETGPTAAEQAAQGADVADDWDEGYPEGPRASAAEQAEALDAAAAPTVSGQQPNPFQPAELPEGATIGRG